MCFLSSNVLLRFCRGRIDRKSMTCTRCRGLIDGCFRLFDIVLTRTFFAAGCAGIYIYIYTHTCNKHPAGPSQGMIIHFDQWLLSCFAWALSFSCCFCILSSDFSMQGFLHACQADLLTACEAFCSEADARISAVRQRALLALAVSFLQHFVRANWTGPPEQAGGKKPKAENCRDLFWGWKKAEKNNDFLVASGSDEFENLLFHCKIVIKKIASAGKIRSIKSHQSHEPFGNWKHTLGLFCTSSTMKWLEEDDATLPFHPSALAEASQGEDVRNLDLKSWEE